MVEAQRDATFPENPMRRALLATLALLPLALAGTANAQGRQDFALVNSTGYQINEIYVGATSSDSWGSDLLRQDVLENRRTFNVRFGSRTSDCNWDIKVVYDDGDVSEFRRVNLCSVSKVTLFWNRQAGTTRFVTE
jgi:hypothetical protein